MCNEFRPLKIFARSSQYFVSLLSCSAQIQPRIERTYPRYCPNFSINTIETIIRKYLNLIQQSIIFKIIKPEYPFLGSVIRTSIGSPSAEKIAQVLQNYKKPNQFLIGAFSSKNLIAVIGFGGAAVGDPACDLVIAWTYLFGKAREIFISKMGMDADTWLRARAWALWKATFELCQIADKSSPEAGLQKQIIDEVVE